MKENPRYKPVPDARTIATFKPNSVVEIFFSKGSCNPSVVARILEVTATKQVNNPTIRIEELKCGIESIVGGGTAAILKYLTY